MQDREKTQRLQRKVRDRSVVLLIVGALLLLPPVGSISLVDGSLAGLPIPVVYVFAVWALLIAAAAGMARPLDSDAEQDTAAQDGPADPQS